MHFTDNTTLVLIYTAQAAQSLIVCVLADIVAGAVYCGQQGLVRAFFFHKMDSSITHTHTHIKKSREGIL